MFSRKSIVDAWGHPLRYRNAGEVFFPRLAAPTGMTSNETGEWRLSCSSYTPGDGVDIFNAFDGLTHTSTYPLWHSQSEQSPWCVWQNKIRKVLVRQYKIKNRVSSAYMPDTWLIQGSNDGILWTTLDSREGVSWSNDELKTFQLANNWTGYYFHRYIAPDHNNYATISQIYATSAIG